MRSAIRRIFVEKKRGFDVEARGLYLDLKENLGIAGLESLRVVNRYDVEGISDEAYAMSRDTIFSEPPVDEVFDESVHVDPSERVIAVEYLPGQYDQRADSASQCIQMLTCGDRPEIKVAKLFILKGEISEDEFYRVKSYLINPVECREASLEKPPTLEAAGSVPSDVRTLEGFTSLSSDGLLLLMNDMGLAMSIEDLRFCQEYFKNSEKRDPTVTEIRVIDTYWSDHCRHTTFLTKIDNIDFEEGFCSDILSSAYGSYLFSRNRVHAGKDRDICLMDIATIAMKELRLSGQLDDLDVSDEINACSITVEADVDGQVQEWLVMFKNETHNHPTEIEPFGGAATCLGGAIRDPLSGRSYVYQAMRVTGSGDPRARIQDTIPGKLPQRKITTGAAAGYSSYGNQIGIATGQVTEIYDEGFVAKRMEIGAVIGAVPKKFVVRGKPVAGDVVILLGGRTGRDGCGGATGSSKEHTEESLFTCGAEVQKGNPPTERKIQRLFRNPEVISMIKRCNDFGAGGVSVAIGELAEGLDIDLDSVPKKYEGLDGTELAISESQERMAVLVSGCDAERFIRHAGEENLEATAVAKVTGGRRLRMSWRGKHIVDISRDFLDTNGMKQEVDISVPAVKKDESFFNRIPEDVSRFENDLEQAWISNLQRLNVCSQRGLVERFDSTIGAGTVIMPFGGRYQCSPAECMIAKIPVIDGDTCTGTVMSFGYNPLIAKWSPFHGAIYAIVEAVAKVAAAGGDYRKIRLSLQEYFEKLGKDPRKWSKPFSALLGAYYAQLKLGIPAIGGKDSMSGTFKDMTVPPTLVAFAVGTVKVNRTVSAEFKEPGSAVIMVPLHRDENDMPDFSQLEKNYSRIFSLASRGRILASHTVKTGGLAEAISKMCFGNGIGFEFVGGFSFKELFSPDYGSIVLEIEDIGSLEDILEGLDYRILGRTLKAAKIRINGIEMDLDRLRGKWEEPLEKIFPTRVRSEDVERNAPQLAVKNVFPGNKPGVPGKGKAAVKIARPRAFIPVFPGTNCEYDTARAFEKAGGKAEILVVRNLTPNDIEQSIERMEKAIDNSQIIVIPGGFSAGDEPDGSGKFIATAFRNPRISEAVMRLLKQRDGLALGICNGFQALIKLGLLPFGEIREIDADCPTLTFNTIGRHMSRMVRTRVMSTLSPWLSLAKPGDIHTVAVSHGEGRFAANRAVLETLAQNGQIATCYVDPDGNPTYDIRYNPNGSVEAIEGITSPDGRVFGKMGHSERYGPNVARNVPGEKDQKIFEAGVRYFG